VTADQTSISCSSRWPSLGVPQHHSPASGVPGRLHPKVRSACSWPQIERPKVSFLRYWSARRTRRNGADQSGMTREDVDRPPTVKETRQSRRSSGGRPPFFTSRVPPRRRAGLEHPSPDVPRFDDDRYLQPLGERPRTAHDLIWGRGRRKSRTHSPLPSRS